jgi:DNA-directed RNA polymerase subunit RPC12/RpoP
MVVAEDNCKSVYCTVTLTFANGTDNYIRWRARDRAGNPYSISDDYQIIVSIPPINEPPDAPKVFSHIETIDTTPLFKWVKGIDPDGDMVYTYIQVGTEPGTYDIIANYTTTGTSITLPELERGRTYYIELWAVDTHNATSPHVQVQLDVLYLPVTISEVLFSDQKLTAGNPVDIYAVIQNQYSTGFNITVYFYDGKPATANDSVLIIGKKTEWLSANGTVSVIVTWQNPTPGNHEIYVIVSNSTPDSEYVKAVTVYEKAGKDEQPPPGTFLPGGFFGLLLLIALIVAIVIIAAAFIIAYRRKRQKEEAPEEKLPPLPPPSPPAKLPEKKAAEAVKPKPPAKPPVAVAKEKAYVTRYEELKEPKQCNICLGTIKPGLIYAACGKCGKIYHESCATRVRKCPRCDAKFTPKPPSMEQLMKKKKAPPVVEEKDIAWVAPKEPVKPEEEELADETVTWE